MMNLVGNWEEVAFIVSAWRLDCCLGDNITVCWVDDILDHSFNSLIGKDVVVERLGIWFELYLGRRFPVLTGLIG